MSHHENCISRWIKNGPMHIAHTHNSVPHIVLKWYSSHVDEWKHLHHVGIFRHSMKSHLYLIYPVLVDTTSPLVSSNEFHLIEMHLFNLIKTVNRLSVVKMRGSCRPLFTIICLLFVIVHSFRVDDVYCTVIIGKRNAHYINIFFLFS